MHKKTNSGEWNKKNRRKRHSNQARGGNVETVWKGSVSALVVAVVTIIQSKAVTRPFLSRD